MSNRGKNKKGEPPAKWKARAKADRAIAWAAVFEKLVDKFGLTGAFLMVASIFVIVYVYATPDQKHKIIDVFVLGLGIQPFYPTLVGSVAFLLLLFAQQHYFQRRIRTLELEVTRLGQWKSDHQQNRIGEPLHHSGSGLGE